MYKMKKIYKLYIGILLSIVTVSCVDTLDADKYFRDRKTMEDIFADKDSTEAWLAHAYSYLAGENMEVSTKENILWCFADDIYFGSGDDYKKFKTGTYDENWRHSWGASYKGIRQASIFIQYIDMNTKFTQEERGDMKAQARFVRAYYYWLLLRRYGPIPILPNEGLNYMDSYDQLERPRNTYDECVEYIESEMRLAAKDLPLIRTVDQIARPTRGAALAARARALLYAASPINNPRPGIDTDKFSDLTDHNGKCLLAQEYDDNKWARAAAAAKDVMELPGNYRGGHRYDLYHKKANDDPAKGQVTVKPYNDNDFFLKTWDEGGYSDIDPMQSYREVFDGSIGMERNPELIFSRGANQGANSLVLMVTNQLPYAEGGGNNKYGMTQKMCDTYYMNDGKNFDRNEFLKEYPKEQRFVTDQEAKDGTFPYLKKGVYKEYAYREPRFYASVAFNGSVWELYRNSEIQDHEKETDLQAFYYRGSSNGYSSLHNWLPTGIGIKKFVNADDTKIAADKIVTKAEPAIRYAEVLLIYAEALNELEDGKMYNIPSWDGASTYSIQRTKSEMQKGIRPVRSRAGVPDYEDSDYQNKDAFRKKLKQERMIELMGEGQRYFDLRRWRDVDVEESKEIEGCNYLMMESQRDYFHTPTVINDLPTAFSRKLYFWPINHDELKRNSLLTQNPGWTYND